MDLDGDDDVIVGAPDANVAMLFLGVDGGTEPTVHAMLAPASDPLARAGWAVGSPGDIDGDDRPDLVICAPGQDPAGAAFVYLARPGITWGEPERAIRSDDTGIGGHFGALLVTGPPATPY